MKPITLFGRASSTAPSGRRRQRGMSMIEVSLSLVISGLAALQMMNERVRTDRITAASLDAGKIATYRKALQDYTDDNYAELQSGLPVSRNAVNLAAGNGAGQSYSPTIAQLNAMGYLVNGFTNDVVFSTGGFQTLIQRFPAGCVTTACTVEGKLWVDQPFWIRGQNVSDGIVVGEILNKLGSNGGVSLLVAPNQITGANNTWNFPNPDGGARDGIVMARFGASVSVVGNFVRINDTRDPNLQGNLTVAQNGSFGGTFNANGAANFGSTVNVAGNTSLQGALGVQGNTTMAGALQVNNLLNATGNITSGAAVAGRAVNSVDGVGVTRASLDGSTGQVTARTAAGATTITLDGATGLASANSVQLQSTRVAGGACGVVGEVVQDNSTSGTLLVCRGGTYKRISMGLGEVVLGTACPTTAAVAQTEAGEGAICRGGLWRLMNDRMPTTVPMALWNAQGAASVLAPTCGVGGVPDIIVSPLHGGSDYGGAPPRNRFEAQVSGAGPWVVNPVLVDTGGVSSSIAYSGGAYMFAWTATTYCVYPA